MEHILVVDHDFLEPELIRRIERRGTSFGFTVRCFDRRKEGAREEAYKSIPDAEILFSVSPKSLEAAGKNLKWFACPWAGVEPFIRHPEYFPSDDVMLTNSNVYGKTIAEHVIMVLLIMMRRMPEYLEAVNERNWLRNLPIEGIIDNPFLVIGTGDLGTNIAARLKGMGASHVCGVNRTGVFHGKTNPFDETRPVEELRSILPTVKGVVLALPDLDDTTHLINKETLALMREDAYLVNVGRGNAVDQKALIEALNAGKLRGAALDVFEKEPLPADDPLWETKNLFITPHISGNTGLAATRERIVELFLANLERYVNGVPPVGLVDRKKGY
ncbi:MAG: D-2-hydroxyacid dehydrogenase [Firmicutes bacterium]|nr:D-2-hydroxyacid dehydrogenase [Bacillota bacterium]